jgi:hypothetical protein
MNLSPYTFDSVAINDGTNFTARFPSPSAYDMSPVEVHYSPRANNYPLYTNKILKERSVTLYIEMLGTAHTQVDTLNAAFDPRKGEVKLLAKDSDDSDKQWYLMAVPDGQPQIRGRLYIIKLRVGFGIWQTETLTTTTWTGAATAFTKAITPVGNVPTRPVFRFKPTSAKVGGFAYRYPSFLFNTVARAIFDGIDLTDGGLNTAAVVASTAKSNTINQLGGIGTDLTPFPIDGAVGGGLPASGMGYCGTEQFSFTISGSTLTPTARGLNGTTAATHADDAIIYLSLINADGSDTRVYMDNVEVDRWFGTGANAFNTAATKIFINIPLQPKIEFALSLNMTDSQTTASFVKNATTQKLFARLPKKGVMYIGTEAMSYTSTDPVLFRVTGLTRGVFGTSAATHTAADAVKWMEHIIWVVNGNSSLTAPTVDDTRKPMFDLTSTNASHVYTTMSDLGGKRTAIFSGSIISKRGTETKLYTGNQGADADPATELGMLISAYQVGTRYIADTADLVWQIAIPQGFSEITATGEKYRTTATWPTATAETSIDGKTWKNLWTDATPASASSWTAWAAHSAVSVSPTAYFFRLRFRGSVPATSGAQAATELNDITFTLAGAPTVVFGASQSTYDLDIKVSNSANSQYFQIRRQIPLNAAFLEVDCNEVDATYLGDNTPGPIIDYPDTQDWPMELVNDVSNTITIDETGLAGMSVEMDHRDWTL